MPQQNMLKGMNEDIQGIKDPGIALIVVYVAVVFIVLLLAGLETVLADPDGAEENMLMIDNAYWMEPLVPAHEQGGFIVEPVFSQNAKLSVSGMTAKAEPSMEVFVGLGVLLLLLALFLAKDGKKR